MILSGVTGGPAGGNAHAINLRLCEAQRHDLAFVRKLVPGEETARELALHADIRREARCLRPMYGVDVIERPLAVAYCPVVDIKDTDEVGIDTNPSAPAGDLVTSEETSAQPLRGSYLHCGAPNLRPV